MKISFLVLVALVSLTVVSAKRAREDKSLQNSDVGTYQEDGIVVEEEATEGKRKGRRKKERWVQAEHEPCSVILAAEEADCINHCDQFQDCNFVIEDEATCAWNCNCFQKIVQVVEEVVESENENEGSNGERRRRKVKKEASGGKRKRKAEGKECSGTKKLSMSNCLLKLKGLISWGDNAKTFEQDWAAYAGE